MSENSTVKTFLKSLLTEEVDVPVSVEKMSLEEMEQTFSSLVVLRNQFKKGTTTRHIFAQACARLQTIIRKQQKQIG